MDKIQEAEQALKKEFLPRPYYINDVGIGNDCLCVYLSESRRREWNLPDVYEGFRVEYVVTGKDAKQYIPPSHRF